MMAPMRRIALALVLATAAFAQGCTLSQANVRKADAIVMQAQDPVPTCTQPDHCAAPSALLDQANAQLASSTADAPHHAIGLLEDGESALVARLNLIRGARHSIDVQTYIWQQDDAGKLILDQLVEAAGRGVKVRILADQLFAFGDAKLLATLARTRANFEIRLYNPTFSKAHTPPLEFAAGIVCCFLRFNQRMHNKLLLIDDAIGIAGGRNYQDRYYDWDDDYDYRDRDVLVAGPAAQQMRTSFDLFWADRNTVALSRLRDVAAAILEGGVSAAPYLLHAYRHGERVAIVSRHADDTDYVRTHFAEAALRVGRVEYFSDAPGKAPAADAPPGGEPSQRIMELVRSARSRIVLQTPYLVLSPTARDVFAKLRRENGGFRVTVSTNSLAATDAFYVYALSHKYKKRYLKLGFAIHEFKPFPAEAAGLIADYASLGRGEEGTRDEGGYRRYGRAPLTRGGVRLGLHAKSMVIDDDVTVIGSHNFDPRSDHYNTESGFIIFDRPVADAVRAAILRDTAPDNAWVIARRARPGFWNRVNNAIADFSTALPLFDFWPFRYATSFELNDGCQPVAPADPAFYDCHTDVGDFPEVDLPLKTIYTRIVTAFGAGLVSIL